MNQAATFGSTRPIIPAGTQLNGIYEIDEPIAAGGMGEIYKGHAIQTGDIVAIKLIRSDLAEAEAAFAMFRKEASALHNLYHEAIVRYYVFTFDPALGRPYLAMEYVDGQSLSTMLRGGPLAFEAVVRLMRRIASGLHAAHERGIIHRDVSPDNIIIPAGDMAQAKIIDFGIARSTRLGDDGTVIGAGFAGKYNYVSPEQLGLFGGDITPKSDIYSLGLVLAEALRNGPIDMGGNHVEVIEKRRELPDVGPIDARLRPLIERMLQPNPDDRPSSMAEVAAWLPEVATVWPPAGRGQSAQTAKTARAGAGVSRTTLLLAGAGAIGLAVAAPLLVAALRPPTPAPPPSPVLQNERPAQAGNAAAPDPAEAAPPSAPAPAQGPAPASVPAPAATGGPGLAPMNLSMLAPEPEPVEPPATENAAQRAEFAALATAIKGFDGGDCFFAAPAVLVDGSAAIEGYGLSTAPFRALDDAFREANGHEADIGVRLVAAPQCPALGFLTGLRATPGAPPKLELAAAAPRAGQPLTGAVSGLDGREVVVLVVADDGSVRAVPTTRSDRDDMVRFSARPAPDSGNGRLQLVVAVAAPKPLASLRPGQPAPASKIFPQALSEAEKVGATLAAAARSFRVGK
jgi:serine/threonine-protein kinase